jgi:hypothetical protein
MVHCAVSDMVPDKYQCVAALKTSFPEDSDEDLSFIKSDLETCPSPCMVAVDQLADFCDTNARNSSLQRAFDILTVALICNHYLLCASLSMLSNLCKDDKAGMVGVHHESGGVPSKEDWRVAHHIQSSDALTLMVSEAKQKLVKCTHVMDAILVLDNFIDTCRHESVSIFSSICAMLPRLMATICEDLKHRYRLSDNTFWRKQVLVHICRFVNFVIQCYGWLLCVDRSEHAAISWPGEESAVAVLQRDIEQERDQILQQSMLQVGDSVARGLKLFDFKTQQVGYLCERACKKLFYLYL